MAAFELALRQGAGGIELDVHLSSDGLPVVIHDPRLSLWLESKHLHDRPCRTPVPLAMIPSGKNSFKLASINRNGSARVRQVPSPAAALGQIA